MLALWVALLAMSRAWLGLDWPQCVIVATVGAVTLTVLVLLGMRFTYWMADVLEPILWVVPL